MSKSITCYKSNIAVKLLAAGFYVDYRDEPPELIVVWPRESDESQGSFHLGLGSDGYYSIVKVTGGLGKKKAYRAMLGSEIVRWNNMFAEQQSSQD